MRWRFPYIPLDVPSVGSTHEVRSTVTNVHCACVSLRSHLYQLYDILNPSPSLALLAGNVNLIGACRRPNKTAVDTP